MVDLLVISARKEGSFLMEQNYIGYIYITTNLINNKKYIGQHKSKSFDLNYLGSGKLIVEAIKKYGKDNFKTEVIEWCTSAEELNNREIYWIQYYNAVNDNNYYNLHDGGGSGWDYVNRCWADGVFTRKPLSEEAKEHMRHPHVVTEKGLKTWGNKGKHLKDETKKKLSDKLKVARVTYAPIWNKGIPQTEEAKRKMLKTREENCIGCVAVRCVETGYIFKSENDALEWLGAKANKISECLSGSREMTYGYHWEVVDNVDLNSIDYSIYDKPSIKWNSIRNKVYLCITTNKEYKNWNEIKMDFKYTRSNCEKIKSLCDNNDESEYLGYKWRYKIV